MTVSSIATGYDGISLLAGNAAYDPAGTFLIQRISPTSGTTVSFTSIPSTYKHLQIRGISRNSDTGGSGLSSVYLTFNSDTGSNYTRHVVYGDGTVGTLGSASQTSAQLVFATLYDGTPVNAYAATILDIHDYASTSKYKTLKSFQGVDANASGDSAVVIQSNLWMSTSAITSITITSGGGTSFKSGTTFALYGMVG